ncbi:MAG TPA: helix-turn-helix domain-containing protein [Blastocatellia bacterium]|nr:helix-turn-helix domain-containing protein [Blastocatellia bacterium]
MKYIEGRPSQRLARYVECYWQLEGSASDSSSAEPIPPDGCPEFIFNCADPFRRHLPDNKTEIQPRILFVGQMTRADLIEPTGCVSLFAIKLKPNGAYPFLQLPLSEFTDEIPGLDSVLGHGVSELEERINLAASFEERIRITESYLLRMMNEAGLNDSHSGQFKAAVAAERIVRVRGQISIDQLSSDLGITSRHLERHFHMTIGIGPKLLARIARFQHVFKLLNCNPNISWSAIAYECGYYDQAHLIKDFKAFAGQNPSRFIEREYDIANSLTNRIAMSDFSNTAF